MMRRPLLRWLRRRPSCHEVAVVLQAFLDGEADAPDVATVEAHLAECADCAIEADVLIAVKAAVARARVPADPAAVGRLRDFAEGLGVEPGGQ